MLRRRQPLGCCFPKFGYFGNGRWYIRSGFRDYFMQSRKRLYVGYQWDRTDKRLSSFGKRVGANHPGTKQNAKKHTGKRSIEEAFSMNPMIKYLGTPRIYTEILTDLQQRFPGNKGCFFRRKEVDNGQKLWMLEDAVGCSPEHYQYEQLEQVKK